MRCLLRSGALRPFVLLLVAAVVPVSFGTASVIGAPAVQVAGTATAVPTPTPTPRPTAKPTPSPPDLALAARFAQDGRFDEAAGAYLSVIAQSTPAQRLSARLGLAQIYRNEGRYSLAAYQLDAYLLEAPAGADVHDAQFMLAATLLSAGDYAGALPLYDAYLRGDGAAAAYAGFGHAEALAYLGQTARADAEAQDLLRLDLPQQVRLNFVLQMAQAFEQTSPRAAAGWYNRLRRESPSPPDQALGLWRSALVQRDLGDDGPWFSAWPQLITQYPDTPSAQEAVDDVPPYRVIGEIIDPYHRGLVYYYAGRDSDARAAFERSLIRNEQAGDGSLAANASFYLGALDERAGAAEDAIAHYARVAALDSGSSLADDAFWWQGRLLEQGGRASEAAAAYKKLVAGYGGSSFAGQARFRLALLPYDAGRAREAADAFAALAESSDDAVRQQALLWRGKALAAAGDEKTARSVWQTLRSEAPDGYFGLRAAVLLGDPRGQLGDAGLATQKEPDWSAIEAWLKEAKGGEPLLARQALVGNPHWSVGSALRSLGMFRQADAEFALLLDRASGDATMLLELARFFRSAGAIDLSFRAAARVLNQVPQPVANSAPPDLWRLAYPAPFAAALRDAADAEEVPDVLLLALVRQESFFDSLAGSTAGAIGLTQVIPSTGQAIAQDLGLSDFQTADLFGPALSLRFGAHYLRQQLDAFDGDVYASLAAYNAGPGNALRWQRAARSDADRFVAEIDFAQTVAYVQLVSENLARYRQLYQGMAVPSLPGD